MRLSPIIYADMALVFGFDINPLDQASLVGWPFLSSSAWVSLDPIGGIDALASCVEPVLCLGRLAIVAYPDPEQHAHST